MTSAVLPDPSVDLTGLTVLTPDPARASRVRSRCLDELRRRQRREERRQERRQERRGERRSARPRMLAPLVLAGFCLIYVVSLVATTLHLQSAFR
jgi:type VI protein secretion system component VasF